MRKISADVIYDGLGNTLKEVVVIYNEKIGVVDIVSSRDIDKTDIEFYKGAIAPGLVNSHCHIELSHLKGIIPTGTGLIPFIQKVVTLRSFPPEEIQEKIKSALLEMSEEGIMAVGDICNTTDSALLKLGSHIQFYNFIECFDLYQANYEEQWSSFQEVGEGFSIKGIDEKNWVPHAPYSVSPELYAKIASHQSPGSTTSIHNQETPDENEFSKSGNGRLKEFYSSLGLTLDRYRPAGTASLNSALNYIDKSQKLLLVHNTMSSMADFISAKTDGREVFWCSCPNANLYIENRLPNYQLWIDEEATICLGTDSLASNWQLSIMEEMKTIQKFNSSIPTELLVQWATLNGAKALGFDNVLGSIEVGKIPGLINFEIDPERDTILSNSRSKKIV